MLIACNGENAKKYALRDSIVHDYIRMIDTSGQYDTTELSHRVLKAFVKNDTIFLKQLQKDIASVSSKRANWNLWNIDIPLPKLQDLKINEGYRFISSLMGTPYYKTVTVTKNNDSVLFHYVLFEKPFGATAPKIKLQDQKTLTALEWENLVQKLEDADFWHLKTEGYPRGRDGSDLTVIGYKKGLIEYSLPDKYQFVHRYWNSTLDDTYFYIYQQLLDKKHRDW